MRRVRYRVASSLDGFIAGPKGEADWISSDPEVDFAALYRQFDTALVGRRTFEYMLKHGSSSIPGMKLFVFSRRLRQSDHPAVTVVGDHPEQVVAEIRAQTGKDIWLFGGGELFSCLAGHNLVDTVEVAIMPVLLGTGILLAPRLAAPAKLKLTGHKIYKSGIVLLEYAMG